MHDIATIRENPEAFNREMAKRGLEEPSRCLLDLDARRRQCQTEEQALRQRQKEISLQIGRLAVQGVANFAETAIQFTRNTLRGQTTSYPPIQPASGDIEQLIAESSETKKQLPELKERGRTLEAELRDALAALPNRLDPEVPEGADEADNLEIRRAGAPRVFDAPPRDHVAIGEALGGMDFAAAARMSGARFVALKGPLARLERALANFMLDHNTREYGYTEVSPPLMVRDDALFGTGQLPKFHDQQFRAGEDRWLIPTSEVPLTNLVAGEILEEADLPLRFAARTPCFRSEAGAAGKDTRGMIRMHQFDKVEMVSICHPDASAAEHERMTECAESILARLGLPFRTVLLCAGDTGFSARKTWDIEVWLPGHDGGRYREISSCSNCGDFQARRMRARFRPEGGRGTAFVHTLNGSGLAVGRTLIAVLENFQRADGGVDIPEALRPWMDGLEAIPAPGTAG